VNVNVTVPALRRNSEVGEFFIFYSRIGDETCFMTISTGFCCMRTFQPEAG
jgi:hypothetical protein